MTDVKAIVAGYLSAIESHDLDGVRSYLHPQVQVIEHPNKINPDGATYDGAQLRAAGERGKAVMASERYEIRSITAEGDRAIAQIAWTGTLRDGRTMRAQICSVIELRDGLVWRQEQYDCFLA
jgi:ketosteroid isomerase-like protein